MWINQGITIVHEIILNDMPSSHPLRILWKKIIYQNQLGNIEHEINSYCNAGFLGLQRSQIAFLDKWIEILNIATSKYDMNMQTFINGPREKPFRALDQDAFNIALMCTSETISEMGPEAMGFANNGLQVMLHATGSPKPWNKKFILNAIKGLPPTTADRGFVSNSNGGLNNYSSFTLKLKKLALNISIFICRFYKKINLVAKQKILFICGSLEKGKDGVGDYSRRLAHILLKSLNCEVSLLALNDLFIDQNLESYENEIKIRRISHLKNWDEKSKFLVDYCKLFQPDLISIQFVPFAYNPKGLPYPFPKIVSTLSLEFKVHIMFHELWVGLAKEDNLKFKLWGYLQKGIIKNMIRKNKSLVISTQSDLYKNKLEIISNKNIIKLPYLATL